MRTGSFSFWKGSRFSKTVLEMIFSLALSRVSFEKYRSEKRTGKIWI